MATMKELTIWVMVDSDGGYAAVEVEEDVCEAFESAVGGNLPRQLYKVLLTVPLPEPVVVAGRVEPAPASGTLTAVAGDLAVRAVGRCDACGSPNDAEGCCTRQDCCNSD